MQSDLTTNLSIPYAGCVSSTLSTMAAASIDQNIEAFITHWSPSGSTECANYQLFLTELGERLNALP